MLGKLMKYELKSTARVFLPIYAVLLFFSILGNFSIGGLLSSMDGGGEISNILSGLVILGYSMAIMSVLIITFVVILQRFYKNLTGDEGYLMHTLPVSTHSLIASKLLASFVWELATFFMVGLSVFILLFQPEFFRNFPDFMAELGEVLRMGFSEMGVGLYLNILLLIMLMVVGVMTGTLLIYASISIGHTFKVHRVLGSMGAYMGLSMLTQLVASIIGSVTVGLNWNWDFFQATTPAEVSSLFSLGLLILLAGELVFAGAWYFVTHYVLTNQLNLE